MSTDLPPGKNLAALRVERGLTQAGLARRAQISLSLLSKIEVGDRTLTPDVARQVGRAMGLSVEEVMGTAPVPESGTAALNDLEDALRDYDLPDGTDVEGTEVGAALIKANQLRGEVKIRELLDMLPGLLRKSTTYALQENDDLSWVALGDVYSIVYWMAARHRWRMFAELAVARQQWAAAQHGNPVSAAVAARDRAGTYLNFGDVQRGLDVVDRAIADAENRLSGEQRAYAVGILNLRGMTLAGRLEDKVEAAQVVAQHTESAARSVDTFGQDDRTLHGLIFGFGSTQTHVLATHVDLGQPDQAIRAGEQADQYLNGLPETRIAPTYINLARAKLDVGDRDGALDDLATAWEVAPEMARIHPMGREVFRVVSSLHKRSNAKLMELSRLSGIDV